MNNKIKLIALFAIITLIGYALFSPSTTKVAEEAEDHSHNFVAFSQTLLDKHEIETQVATNGTLKQVVRAPAQIIIGADNVAHILPKAPGIALNANKNLGEHVAVNELLATLESKEMAEAKAAYLTAQMKEQLANKTFKIEKNLFEKNIVSAEDYNKVENSWEEAKIELVLAQQKLHGLGLGAQEIDGLTQALPNSLREYQVRAPIAGQIISRHITFGEWISTEQEIYVIADLSKVWAEISIFAQDRPYVKEGQILTISSPEGNTTQAKVIYLSPIITTDTRTSIAIAEIENSSEQWLPGTFVQALLTTQKQPVALIVPKESVQNIEGTNAIFVAENDGFVVRPVSTGKADEDCYEVVAGLKEGEKYASKNVFLLKAELLKDEAEHTD